MENIRNLCIIAHVDHGKTTLSDCLLQYAGLTSTKQSCALDTLPEEKEKGITIQSTAVTLEFEVDDTIAEKATSRPRILLVDSSHESESFPQEQQQQQQQEDQDRKSQSALDESTSEEKQAYKQANLDTDSSVEVKTANSGCTELHLSNLPFDCTEADVQAMLQPHIFCEEAVKLELRPKRGFGFVEMTCSDAARVVELCSQKCLEMGGRTICVQWRGPRGSCVLQLRNVCRERSWNAPRFTEVEICEERSAMRWQGRVEIYSKGCLVHYTVCDESLYAETKRCARENVAKLAMQKLCMQPHEKVQEKEIETMCDEKENTEICKQEAVETQICEHLEIASSPSCKQQLTVNLVDSPGHLDFSAEVTAALRLSDGALVVVDCIEGARVQTQNVLRQALANRVRPVLVLNKVDRAIFELSLTPQEAFERFSATVNQVNSIIATYQDPRMPDMTVSLASGTVALGSALHGWFFTINTIEDMFAARGLDREKFQSMFSTRQKFERNFVAHVLEPIFTMCLEARQTEEKEDFVDQVLSRLARVGITLSVEEKSQRGKALMKAVMRRFCPAARTLIGMICEHLPGPREAQWYRTSLLYTGDSKDEFGRSIQSCDSGGPLMIYVAKMVVIPGTTRCLAFGRVFSGSVSAGQEVHVMENLDGQIVRASGCVQGLFCVMAGRLTPLSGCVGSGSIVGIAGLDKSLRNCGTISSSNQAHPLSVMSFSVSPVLSVSVRPMHSKDVKQVQQAMRVLSKLDLAVRCYTDEETKENVLACVGELHLEICLSRLRELAAVPLLESDPRISYRESVGASSHVCLTKSANKHNRIFAMASQVQDDLVHDLESGAFSRAVSTLVLSGVCTDLPSARARVLVEQYGWDTTIARRVWAVGPETRLSDAAMGTNLLVDNTRAVAHLQNIRDSIVQAFYQVVDAGPLCGEKVRGVCFTLVDALVHSDPSHRGPRQIIPTASRAFKAAMLFACPVMQEPVLSATIEAPHHVLGAIYSTVSRRRGLVFNDNPVVGTPLHNLQAHLPTRESLGFHKALKEDTSGEAVAHCSFSHWALVPGCPNEQSITAEIIAQVRTTKGMPPNLPDAQALVDRL